MRTRATATFITAALGACVACSAPPPRPGPTQPAPAVPHATSWRDAYDLDGDGTNDRIISEFTGGGHCCYRIGAALSSTGVSTVFPFEMDGGYPAGLDLSQPTRFTVRTRDGGIPEIVYEIDVYNGEPQPIDPETTQRWGIRSHRVVLCFAGGNPRVRDDASDLLPCKR